LHHFGGSGSRRVHQRRDTTVVGSVHPTGVLEQGLNAGQVIYANRGVEIVGHIFRRRADSQRGETKRQDRYVLDAKHCGLLPTVSIPFILSPFLNAMAQSR
jgi:hypothetical protein